MGLGRLLGSIWKALERSWASSGRSWALLGRFLPAQKKAFFQHWPKMGSKGASGSILGGICEDFGRIWEGFGQNFFHVGLHLKGFGQRYGRIWANLEKTGAASLNRTPALIREASQCAGVLSHRVLNRILGNGSVS